MKKLGMSFRTLNRKAVLLFVGLALIAAVVLIAGFSPITSPAQAQDQTAKAEITGPTWSRAVKFDVSPPLRSMKPLLRSGFKAEDDSEPLSPSAIERHEPDPVVQSSVGLGIFGSEIPGPSVSFDGIQNTCGCSPPDTDGEVGPNHYVQMVNLHFRIFSKTGTPLAPVMAINTLWAGFGGPCQTENAGDPVVLYDQLADRWLLSQFSDTGAPFFNCVAVSTSPDPLGTYNRYAFSAPVFPDYPKYGVWPDAYYLNTRESQIGNYALNRAKMLAGDPTAEAVRFGITQPGVGPNGLLPSDLDGGTLPPAGAPNVFVGTTDNDNGAAADQLLLYKFHVDFVTPGNSSFTGPVTIPIAPFDTIYGSCSGTRNCIPQPNGTFIDILSYRQRPTFRAAYRKFPDGHEAIVTNQSVEAQASPLVAGMRWWEIRDPAGTPTLFQEGTYAPGVTDGIHRWMGSIAQDKDGNMALGYSVSNATTVFPGVRYTGRLVSDPLGTMPQGEGTI